MKKKKKVTESTKEKNKTKMAIVKRVSTKIYKAFDEDEVPPPLALFILSSNLILVLERVYSRESAEAYIKHLLEENEPHKKRITNDLRR